VPNNTMTAEQLRGMKCAHCGDNDPNCEGMVLASRCHPEAGARVVYQTKAHKLVMTCAACGTPILNVQLPNGEARPVH
jgi:hypothetical protein